MGLFCKTVPLNYHNDILKQAHDLIVRQDKELNERKSQERNLRSQIDILLADIRALNGLVGQLNDKLIAKKRNDPHQENNTEVSDIDAYQKQMFDNNLDTLGEPLSRMMMLYALGLTGESGEVADYIKKVSAHGLPMNRPDFIDELGDVLWYLSQLSAFYGIKMSEVMEANSSKVLRRYPHGFRMHEPKF